MFNFRDINPRRLWLSIGILAFGLSLMGMLLLPTSTIHASLGLDCKDTSIQGTNGPIAAIFCGSKGQEELKCTVGQEVEQATNEKGSKGLQTAPEGAPTKGTNEEIKDGEKPQGPMHVNELKLKEEAKGQGPISCISEK